MITKEKHIHEYKEIKLFRIVKVQDKYEGSTGDKAFLYRACGCKKGQAFEYGPYPKMKQLLESLV